MAVLVVMTTAPDDKSAALIARESVENRLAACAQVLPGINSYYWWEGQIEDQVEHIIFLKTTAQMLDGLIEKIRDIHPYDVPEIVALEVKGGEDRYLQWIAEETGG